MSSAVNYVSCSDRPRHAVRQLPVVLNGVSFHIAADVDVYIGLPMQIVSLAVLEDLQPGDNVYRTFRLYFYATRGIFTQNWGKEIAGLILTVIFVTVLLNVLGQMLVFLSFSSDLAVLLFSIVFM